MIRRLYDPCAINIIRAVMTLHCFCHFRGWFRLASDLVYYYALIELAPFSFVWMSWWWGPTYNFRALPSTTSQPAGRGFKGRWRYYGSWGWRMVVGEFACYVLLRLFSSKGSMYVSQKEMHDGRRAMDDGWWMMNQSVKGKMRNQSHADIRPRQYNEDANTNTSTSPPVTETIFVSALSNPVVNLDQSCCLLSHLSFHIFSQVKGKSKMTSEQEDEWEKARRKKTRRKRRKRKRKKGKKQKSKKERRADGDLKNTWLFLLPDIHTFHWSDVLC